MPFPLTVSFYFFLTPSPILSCALPLDTCKGKQAEATATDLLWHFTVTRTPANYRDGEYVVAQRGHLCNGHSCCRKSLGVQVPSAKVASLEACWRNHIRNYSLQKQSKLENEEKAYAKGLSELVVEAGF
ncbi:uncharacterized protein EI90DRAFT_54108 [Cantharellus anzutake]|uniref:uncharacterized protein n=1 Tax=Cantharellus anzutake TaxID=1750568 RepID=UPI001904CC7B|nr:uncharacterized protein EI90DRAFT_54108 [Cantharellus anzutake]KAF8344178.1 hypothetical protein EI90DRAFT_54108 [Cantharellus anzutake]